MFNKAKGKRRKAKGLGKGLYLLPVALCLTNAPAWSAPLQNWQYDPAANRLEVTVKDGVRPRYFLMAQPARIVLDLPETEVGNVPIQQTFDGAIRQIRVSQFQPGLTRIVLELSPDTVLAREQAQLQKVGDVEKSGDRWVLRPLIASSQPAAVSKPAVPSASTEAATPPVVYPPGISPTEITPNQTGTGGVPVETNPLPSQPPKTEKLPAQTEKPIDITVSRPRPTSLPSTPAPAVSTSLPPATTPTVVATPTPPTPDRFPPGIAPTPAETIAPIAPNSEETTRTQKPLAPVPQSSGSVTLQLPDVNPSLNIPDSLPPVTAPNAPSRAPTVSVPPLDRRPATAIPDAALPPAIANPPNSVSVPPLPSAATNEQPLPARTIEFGQRLPISSRTEQPPQSTQTLSYNSTGVSLPAGTLLTLRYPGTQALPLQAGQPRQEALILQTEVRDSNGALLVPEGSPVLGRFETNSSGSRFIAQTISLRGQSVAIAAESEPIGGTRKVSDNRLIRNSGIGALAGAILGGLSGGNVFGGAAAGAAVTYVTAPKPAIIQPGQVVQVRLTEDLR